MSESRRLAAILAADVVGFSRMAGADEDRTLARLRALRSDLIDPTVAVHNGRVFKRTGDGALIEFRSVVDAVRCAVEVQNAMVERNAGVSPERRIEFRIGIHLGDVVEEADGDLMGDGVNIAARLEGIAQPGAICLSEDAFRQVKARLELAVSDLGITQLKNIAEPIHVYSLGVGAPAKRKPAPQSEFNAPAAKSRGPFGLVIAAALVCIALLAGVYAWRSGLASRITGAPSVEDTLASCTAPFDRRYAFHEPFRRPGAGLFRGRESPKISRRRCRSCAAASSSRTAPPRHSRARMSTPGKSARSWASAMFCRGVCSASANRSASTPS